MKKLIWNKHTKHILKLAAGWLCILLGILMLVTPGQGIITILIGIFILADHVPGFGRLKNYLVRRFPKTADFVHREMDTLKAKFRKKND